MLVSAVIISAPTLSADHSQTKQQAQRFSSELNHYYHEQSSIENFRVNEINHQFILGHGLIFTISTNIDELMVNQKFSQQVMAKTAQQQQHVLANESSAKQEPKQQLNKLRFQARNIAHQEFSLQNQISSMQARSLQSANEEQKQAIDSKIRKNQDKLKNIIFEKAKVSRDIAHYSKQVAVIEAQVLLPSRAMIYQELVKQSYQLLCHDIQLIEQVAEEEQLTLIFEGLGETDAQGFQDEVLSINQTTLMQCNNNDISVEQAFMQGQRYQY